MSKRAMTSPQRLRESHKASFPVESVSWDGERFTARCVACGTGTCFGRGATSPEALGKLECNAHMRDEAARRSNEKEDMI